MNRKRILLVTIGILGILTVALGAAGFTLTSGSAAQVDEAVSNPPAALTADRSVMDYEANYEANYMKTKDSSLGYDSTLNEGYGCSHDSAQIDWSAED